MHEVLHHIDHFQNRKYFVYYEEVKDKDFETGTDNCDARVTYFDLEEDLTNT